MSTVEVETRYVHIAQLLRTAERLTERFRCNGRQYRHLIKLKKHYKEINDYQRMLQNEKWHNLCDRLGKQKGLSELWGIFRSLARKSKTKLPIMNELMLQAEKQGVYNEVIHTFFPHATRTLDHLPPIHRLAIPNPQENLEQPFTMGELVLALGQGKRRSAPAHDGLTWQDLRNLPTAAKEALLGIINQSGEQGMVNEYLKLTIIHPISKPGRVTST